MAFDLEVFNRQVYTAATEVVDQQVELFNANSNGTIVLRPSNVNMGDFSMEASFKAISKLVRRRDVSNGTNAVDAVRLGQLKNVSVKVASGTSPIVWERAQFAWIKQNPAQAAAVIGEQLAKAMLQDQLNVAIKGLVAAMGANSAVVLDKSGDTGKEAIRPAYLAAAAGLFGDRQMDIAAWVIHSKSMTDLWQNALTNAEQLFRYESVAVMRDPFGRIFVMTDSPDLLATNVYSTLGLVEGAALVEPNNDFDAVTVDTTGKENIQTTYQAEWSYNLGLRGYAWKTAVGGAAPNDTALGTGTNWEKVVTSNKDTAGVLLKTK